MRQNQAINKNLYMNLSSIQSKLYHLILILQINKKEKERKNIFQKYCKKVIKGKKGKRKGKIKKRKERVCERDERKKKRKKRKHVIDERKDIMGMMGIRPRPMVLICGQLLMRS